MIFGIVGAFLCIIYKFMYKYTKRFTYRGYMPGAAGRVRFQTRIFIKRPLFSTEKFLKKPSLFFQKKNQKRLHFKHIRFIISTKEDENMTYNEILGVCMKRRNKSLRTMADNMGTTYQNIARMVNGRKNKDGKLPGNLLQRKP